MKPAEMRKLLYTHRFNDVVKPSRVYHCVTECMRVGCGTTLVQLNSDCFDTKYFWFVKDGKIDTFNNRCKKCLLCERQWGNMSGELCVCHVYGRLV